MPSGRSSTRTPIFPNSRASVAIRSDSLTRSSAASLIVVAPRATTAATARAGTSSIKRGTSGPPTRAARSSAAPRVRLAAGSASSPVPAPTTSTRAPIASSAVRIPVRVGFTPTPVTLTRASRTIAAATSRNAAEETSPGTHTVVPSRSPGSSVTRPPSTRSRAPNWRSIRSEWSRDGAGSCTETGPSA